MGITYQQEESGFDDLPTAEDFFGEQKVKSQVYEVKQILEFKKGWRLCNVDFSIFVSKRYRKGALFIKKWMQQLEEQQGGVFSNLQMVMKVSRKKTTGYVDAVLGVDDEVTVFVSKETDEDLEETTLILSSTEF